MKFNDQEWAGLSEWVDQALKSSGPELEELLNLADRIAVMFEGRIMGIVDAAAASVEEIGSMMAGIAAGGTSTAGGETKETRHGETL